MKTNVTATNYVNVYAYSARRLWIAYGLAVGLATIAVIIGLTTLLFSRASYSNNFSTILRNARNATLSVKVDQRDLGQDPLPKSLAEATVIVSSAAIYAHNKVANLEGKTATISAHSSELAEKDRSLPARTTGRSSDLRPLAKATTT